MTTPSSMHDVRSGGQSSSAQPGFEHGREKASIDQETAQVYALGQRRDATTVPLEEEVAHTQMQRAHSATHVEPTEPPGAQKPSAPPQLPPMHMTLDAGVKPPQRQPFFTRLRKRLRTGRVSAPSQPSARPLRRRSTKKVRSMRQKAPKPSVQPQQTARTHSVHRSQQRHHNRWWDGFRARLQTPQATFAMAACAIFVIASAVAFAGNAFVLKGTVLGQSTTGYRTMLAGVEQAAAQNFIGSAQSFESAAGQFAQARADVEEINRLIVELSRFIPKASQLYAGRNMIVAAEELAVAGEEVSELAQVIRAVENPLAADAQKQSLLETFRFAQKKAQSVHARLTRAQTLLATVPIDDIPEAYRDKFIVAKSVLPAATASLESITQNQDIIEELLGGNGPRKYLFLFQNNHEIRATGGFIGSYGRMDLHNGVVNNFFIDGIYNPSGQFKEDIIPPRPIQKISAGWSLHDSNWFAHFPDSAQKAIDFYEKTGGPTVDGVITITPVMMEKFLAITGPIYMEEYDVTLTSDNFIEVTQEEVEFNYDKEENRPKQILADLAPIVMAKLFKLDDKDHALQLFRALNDGLTEKHILIYAHNPEIQQMLLERGWAGAVHQTDKDYLSIVNSNINGFKTDGVIDEAITHETAIQEDGSVINTVTITRTHNGGTTGKPLWDKVNSNFMRVYVPLGSEFLSVTGHTRELTEPPLDYEALGFRTDPDVIAQESKMQIDEQTGTRIFEEAGKTVFGNWVYVSPQETVTVTYTYKLPFTIDFIQDSSTQKSIASYTMIFQKQHGSLGSTLDATVTIPEPYDVVWSNTGAAADAEAITMQEVLKTDQYMGVVFER